MGYVVTGGICLMIGCVMGLFITALLTANSRYEDRREITPEEVQDADR